MGHIHCGLHLHDQWDLQCSRLYWRDGGGGRNGLDLLGRLLRVVKDGHLHERETFNPCWSKKTPRRWRRVHLMAARCCICNHLVAADEAVVVNGAEVKPWCRAVQRQIVAWRDGNRLGFDQGRRKQIGIGNWEWKILWSLREDWINWRAL
jgi:hypothetical protein